MGVTKPIGRHAAARPLHTGPDFDPQMLATTLIIPLSPKQAGACIHGFMHEHARTKASTRMLYILCKPRPYLCTLDAVSSTPPVGHPCQAQTYQPNMGPQKTRKGEDTGAWPTQAKLGRCEKSSLNAPVRQNSSETTYHLSAPWEECCWPSAPLGRGRSG